MPILAYAETKEVEVVELQAYFSARGDFRFHFPVAFPAFIDLMWATAV